MHFGGVRADPEDVHIYQVMSSVWGEAIACMTFPSDIKPFSVLSRIKAITVLKKDKTEAKIRPGLLACHLSRGGLKKGLPYCNNLLTADGKKVFSGPIHGRFFLSSYSSFFFFFALEPVQCILHIYSQGEGEKAGSESHSIHASMYREASI